VLPCPVSRLGISSPESQPLCDSSHCEKYIRHPRPAGQRDPRLGQLLAGLMANMIETIPDVEMQAAAPIMAARTHSEVSLVKNAHEEPIELPKSDAIHGPQQWTVVGGMMLGIYLIGLDTNMLATVCVVAIMGLYKTISVHVHPQLSSSGNLAHSDQLLLDHSLNYGSFRYDRRHLVV
jgi:hypothetical protein